MAVMVTLAAMAVPVYGDLAQSSRLNAATRDVERELQGARLKAVSSNRSLRVRLNCPAAGQYRTVEVLGAGADGATNRCSDVSYPFPPADQDPFTRPNLDGPVRRVDLETALSSAVIEFRSNGTAWDASTGSAQLLNTLDITVTRRGRTRTVNINGMGRIHLQ